MEMKDIFLGIDGNYSFLNFNIDIDYMLINGLYNIFLVTDEYEYRLDKISMEFYGNYDYILFILLANRLKTINEVKCGRVLYIPSVDYINKLKELMRKERL